MNYESSKIDFRKLNPIPLNGGGLLRGAHHPHCDRHSHHLIWIFGHPLCLGCTCMYSGIIVGLPITLAASWSTVSPIQWLLLHILFLLPTLFQPWLQKKPYKITARFILGVSISSYLVSGLLLIAPPFNIWLFRCFVVLLFAFLYRGIKYIRNRNTYNPCSDCPLGIFPTCDWNLPRLLSDNPDIELLKVIKNIPNEEQFNGNF